MNYYSRPGLNYAKREPHAVISTVCRHFNLNPKDIRKKNRARDINEARSIVAYVLHKNLGLSSTKTGEIINRDHATVLHLSKKVEGFIEIDKEYSKLINQFI